MYSLCFFSDRKKYKFNLWHNNNKKKMKIKNQIYTHHTHTHSNDIRDLGKRIWDSVEKKNIIISHQCIDD